MGKRHADATTINAETLAALREKLGLTKEGMARALGVSRQSYFDYEDGTRPAPPYLRLAAAALKAGLKPLE
jgi:DNA-binding XRE family transcriptional regulator